MNHRRTDDSESRFAGYVEGLASVIGHKDREEPLRHYCTGLLMPCERKSVEPMAAITAPHRTAAQHQSLLHFIGEGKWSDEKVAFGWGGAAILRPAWQAGQLSGRSIAVAGQSSCEPAGGLSALSAARLGG
jgi:hypothetical protein